MYLIMLCKYLVLRWMYKGTPGTQGTPGSSMYLIMLCKCVYLVLRWMNKGTPGTPGKSRY